MGRWILGPVSEFSVERGFSRALFEIDGVEVGVFRAGDGLRAYRSVCPHQGGPVCEGDVGPKIEAEYGSPLEPARERFVDDRPTLRCPWHGWEFDLATGRSIADARLGLREYELVEEDGVLYLVDS
jgi:nitrite reductase (NADH) small subunit